MENNNKQSFGFFSEIQGFIWKMIIGLVSFAIVVPYLIDQAGDILGIPPKASFAIILVMYFVTPLVFFVVWFAKRDIEGFKQILDRSPKVGCYYYSWIIFALFAALAIVFPFSPVFSILFYTISSLFLLSVFIYIGYVIWLYASSESSGDGKGCHSPGIQYRKLRKRLSSEFALLLVIAVSAGILYFNNAFFRNEHTNQCYVDKEKFEMGFNVMELNLGQIGPLDNLVQQKYNELIRVNSLGSISEIRLSKNRQITHYRALDKPLKTIFRSLDTLGSITLQKNQIKRNEKKLVIAKIKTTYYLRKLSDHLQKLHGLIEKDQPQKVSQADIQNFENILNMPKAIIQKADLIYSNSWADILRTVQVKGLFLFFIVLLFLLAFSFHASMANLDEQYEGVKKSISGRKIVLTDPESPAKIREILEKPTFPEIRTIKILISIIILLIVPIFKPVNKETIRLDRPLWQFNLPGLLLGSNHPIIVKQETPINFNPVDNSRTEYQMDKKYIDSVFKEQRESIINSLSQTIDSSEKATYDKFRHP
ncbi:MAG: hypothetical protein Q8M08_10310 [Bacteroidales bacterium]|nr:hypothetical protein [Bacteroidales bacterium]